MTHSLKTYRKWFQRTWDRKKMFEVRENDRDFQAGDRVELLEASDDDDLWTVRLLAGGPVVTGRKITGRIAYVFPLSEFEAGRIKSDYTSKKGALAAKERQRGQVREQNLVVLQLTALENHKAPPKRKAKR